MQTNELDSIVDSARRAFSQAQAPADLENARRNSSARPAASPS
jgi:hypothetical protein